MTIEVELVEVPACPTAVRHAHTTIAELAATIGALLGPLWEYLRTSDLVTGHNIVLYRGEVGAEDGVSIEVGVQVDRPVTATPDGIAASELPAALVARAIHRGPYHRLGETHEAVVRWCRDHGHRRTGVSWEIYGDWTDDPDALEATVVHAIEPPN